MSKIEAVVFDMDGVLIDSEPIWIRRDMEFLKSHGVEVSREEASRIAGLGGRETWELIAGWWGENADPEELQRMCHEEIPLEEHSYADMAMPHLRYLLERLKQHGLRLAIASASPHDGIERVLDECGVASYFEFVVSGEDFERSKPDPAVYLHALERLGLFSDKVAAMEDSTYGVQAAHAAGLRVVARFDARFPFDHSEATVEVADLLEAADALVAMAED